MSRITPLVLAVALFMEMMDSTVIATSLPAIAADIGTEPIALKLALTAYLVALAIFIPLSGWMADRYGARHVFRAAILVFMAGSVACAFSDSLTAFVLARFVQGMGGSMMTPLARLILLRSTPRKELVSAWAWLMVPALAGPMAGPPLGGFLTTFLSWHWIFWINVPIGIIGIGLASRFLPRHNFRDRRPIDTTGFVLTGLSFAGIVLGLSVISMPALPPIAGIGMVAGGIVTGLVYLIHARRIENPILDFGVLRHPVFRAAVASGSLFRFGLGAIPFLLPLFLQLGFGYTPFRSGMTTFVGAIGAIVVKFGATRVYATFGFRPVLVIAVLAASALIGALGLFSAETPVIMMMIVILFSGYSRSMFFTGLNALTFTEIEDHETTQATIVVSVIQQLSFAFGVALAAGLLELSTVLRDVPSPEILDFKIAFFLAAVIASFGVLPLIRLRPDAGSDISGHARRRRPTTQSRNHTVSG